MSVRKVILAVLLAFALPAIAAGPGLDIEIGVNRVSEFKLTKKQTRILDEASKLSAACRVFYGIYDRWPRDLSEIESRTSGIDFASFDDKASLEIVPEGLVITVFDSKDDRQLLATPGAPLSDEVRAQANDPAFKIRMSLRK